MADIPHKNNFDLLRLILALSVCLAHIGGVSGIQAFSPMGDYFNSSIAVDCFFVVSGFLIFRSYNRSSSLLSYYSKRLRRIYPAYLTVVLLAAIVLPLLIGSGANLIFSAEWFRYLFSNLIFLNFLQPHLSGIFSANALAVINAPLWTIKIEVLFYLSVPLIFFLFRNRKKWLILVLLYSASISYSLFLIHLYLNTGFDLYLRLEKQLPGQLAFFLSGGGLYIYFSIFKNHYLKLLLPSLLFLTFKGSTFIPEIYPFYPLALAITVLSFALIFPYLGNWGKYGDISYGVYIYHFPILQVFTYLGLLKEHPWIGFSFFIFAVLVTSACSYHFIERPFLRKSSHYRQAAGESPSP